jgi:hypothetical protein
MEHDSGEGEKVSGGSRRVVHLLDHLRLLYLLSQQLCSPLPNSKTGPHQQFVSFLPFYAAIQPTSIESLSDDVLIARAAFYKRWFSPAERLNRMAVIYRGCVVLTVTLCASRLG